MKSPQGPRTAYCLAECPRGTVNPTSSSSSSTVPSALRREETGERVRRVHEARRYLLSFPRPQRNDRCSSPWFVVGYTSACAPGAIFRATMGARGAEGALLLLLLLLPRCMIPRLRPRANRNGSYKRVCVHASTRTGICLQRPGQGIPLLHHPSFSSSSSSSSLQSSSSSSSSLSRSPLDNFSISLRHAIRRGSYQMVSYSLFQENWR